MSVRVTSTPYRLSEVPLLGGAELKLSVANIVMAVPIVGFMHIWQYLIVTVIMHYVFVMVAKNDPRTRIIYNEYKSQGDRYSPWPEKGQMRFSRPFGFARGENT